MANPGDTVLLRYDVPGAEIWHERIILAASPSVTGSYAVLTPDGDLYVELILGSNPDLADIRSTRGLVDLPRGLEEESIYRFDSAPEGMSTHFWDGALLVGAPTPATDLRVRTISRGQGGPPGLMGPYTAPPPAAGALQPPMTGGHAFRAGYHSMARWMGLREAHPPEEPVPLRP